MTAQTTRKRRVTMMRVAAAVGTVLIGGALLPLATRSHQPAPANAAVTPPRCTKADDRNEGVVGNGFLVNCGHGSAVVRSAGRWHVMNTGVCVDDGHMYFGVRTRRNVPHAGLSLSRDLNGDDKPPISGEIETVPGVKEHVSGTVSYDGSNFSSGTFILHGRLSGRTYTGSWWCPREFHEPDRHWGLSP